MNNNVKVHLTIEMESGALVRKDVAQEFGVRDEKGVEVNKFQHRSLFNKPSFKVIQLNEDAYKHFRSFDSRGNLPGSCRKYREEWGRITADQRLERWLNIICLAERGKSFVYEVFED
jgi:hypothetical protein